MRQYEIAEKFTDHDSPMWLMYTECAACVNLHGGFAQVRNVEPSPLQGVLVVADLPVGFSSNQKEVS